MAEGNVLVTGGSGYIAGFCILKLLEDGWTVRGTLRSLGKENETRAILSGTGAGLQRLSFVEADLSSDKGWADAVRGVDYVLHVASPLPATTPRNDDELVIPAREGTLRVLRAARDAGAKRTVVTSSTAAVFYGRGSRETPFTEEDWTDPANLADTSPYVRSKALAERAAWDWHAKEGGAMELATVNPGAVLGPVLGADFSASIEIVRKLLDGSVPGCPRLGFMAVDPRDLADLHLRAMTNPAAAGQRFLGVSEFYWMLDIAKTLRTRLPELAARIPQRQIPDFVTRIVSLFDREIGSIVFELGKVRKATPAKAEKLLGWRPRPVADSVVDCARSLEARKLI